MKKGFTLIELLAVIVILSVIMLIAVPIVRSVISNTKASAVIRSAENYLDAVELSLTKELMLEEEIYDGVYRIMHDGNICLGSSSGQDCDGEVLKVSVKGKIPTGTLMLMNSKISRVNLYFDSVAIIKNNKGELVLAKSLCNLAPDSILYGAEVGAKYICDLGDSEASQDLSFYVLESSAETNMTYLIQGENYNQNKYTYCIKGTEHCDPTTGKCNKSCNADGLERVFNSAQSEWNKLDADQIVLPTAEQIAGVDGLNYADKPTLKSEWLYADQNGPYYTSTIASWETSAYLVLSSGKISTGSLANPFGVRFVIMIEL